jgi:hypothetical protein
MSFDMKITIDNYEAYLLDLLEGRLDEAQVNALREFVLGHPALGSWDELTGEMPGLLPDELVFAGKDFLKKPEIAAFGNINETNYEYYFVSELEGLLDERESKQLNVFMKANPHVQQVYDIYMRTQLKPDAALVFPSKESLYQKTVEMPVNMRYVWGSIAAFLLLLFSLSWWFLGSEEVLLPEDIAINQQPVKSNVEFVSQEISESPVVEKVEAGHSVEKHVLRPEKQAADEPEVLLRKELLPVMAAILSDAISLRTGSSPVYVRQTTSSQMARLNSGVVEQGSDNKVKPLLGKIVGNAAGKLASNLLPSGLMEVKSENPETEKRSSTLLWDLASAGVKTYNLLTDNEVLLTKAHDQQGNLAAIGLQSERINIARRLGSSVD